VKIRIARRALREIERAARWWHDHRQNAPELFEAELRDTLEQIRKSPQSPAIARVSRGRATCRVLMRETRYYVYYRVEPPDVVLIQSLWGRRPRPRSEAVSASFFSCRRRRSSTRVIARGLAPKQARS
jgi:plasmid stabilization system protein ParE